QLVQPVGRPHPARRRVLQEMAAPIRGPGAPVSVGGPASLSVEAARGVPPPAADAARPSAGARAGEPSVADRLFTEPFAFDLFNHRFISLFFRAWEKYRFYVPYERGEYAKAEPDPFTLGLFSLVGMGVPQLRNRLRVSAWEEHDEGPRERVLARIDELALL